MNSTLTRFFMACLVVLVATIGYGAIRFASIAFQGMISPQNALFTGNGIFDVQSAGSHWPGTFGSSGGRTGTVQQMFMTPTTVMTPPPFDENEENESDGYGQLRGTVTAVNGNVVTINGQTYTLVPKHSDVMGYFQVGSDVRIEYSMNPNGTLTIEELKVVNGQVSRGDSSNQGFSTPSPYGNYYYYYNDDDGDGD